MAPAPDPCLPIPDLYPLKRDLSVLYMAAGAPDSSAGPNFIRPVLEEVWSYLDCLPWGRHCYAYKLEVYGRVGLEVWCKDLCVFAKVELESIAFPLAHGLHDVEGYAPE